MSTASKTTMLMCNIQQGNLSMHASIKVPLTSTWLLETMGLHGSFQLPIFALNIFQEGISYRPGWNISRRRKHGLRGWGEKHYKTNRYISLDCIIIQYLTLQYKQLQTYIHRLGPRNSSEFLKKSGLPSGSSLQFMAEFLLQFNFVIPIICKVLYISCGASFLSPV